MSTVCLALRQVHACMLSINFTEYCQYAIDFYIPQFQSMIKEEDQNQCQCEGCEWVGLCQDHIIHNYIHVFLGNMIKQLQMANALPCVHFYSSKMSANLVLITLSTINNC